MQRQSLTAMFACCLGLAAPLVAMAADPSSAQGIAERICHGEVRAQDVVREAIERARAHPALNAFVTLDADGALEAARTLDKADRSARCRALAGVPIVVKDNIAVAGLPLTGGSPALERLRPTADAPVVARLRDAGAIVLGKTQMHELAFGISGYNPAFQSGPQPGVRNAYDLDRVAGGSSSGTAAAIGARIVPAGLGTDTGGSVRIPCAFNGCAALRPTVGRYSSEGILPISHTRDTAGPMALAMGDVELLDRLITRAEPVAAARLDGVRLGRVRALEADLDADTRAAFDAAIARLQNAGATVVESPMPGLLEINARVGFPVALYEAYDDMVAFLRNAHAGITIEQLAANIASPDVKGTYEAFVLPRKLPGPDGKPIDARPAYEAAIRTERPRLQALYRDSFAEGRLDAIVFPTVPHVAMRADPQASSPEVFASTIRNTDPGSNAGVPGLQLPIALGAQSRLPIGLELDGPAGSDRRLIAIGLALEKLFGILPAPSK